jgi:hypothetical protein
MIRSTFASFHPSGSVLEYQRAALPIGLSEACAGKKRVDDYISPYDTATSRGYFRSELPFDQPRYPVRENPLTAAGDQTLPPRNLLPNSP